MKWTVVALLSLVGYYVQAQHPTFSDKDHFLEGNCATVNSTEAIPEEIKSAFASATKEKKFSLANPGKPFQMTDVVVHPSLPLRRLIFAGSCDGRWFVYYEHGGYGLNYRLLVFSDERPVKSFLGVVSLKKANTLNELRDGPASVKRAKIATDYW